MYPLCETLWKVSQTPNSKQQPHCTEHCTTRACLTQQQHSEPRVRTAYVHVAPLAKPRTQHTNSTVAYIANRSTTATHPHGCAYIASHCSNAVHRHRSSSLACLHCSTHRSKWAHAHTHIRGCAERARQRPVADYSKLAPRHQPQRLMAQSAAAERSPLTFPNERGEKRPLRPPSPLPKPYHHCLEPSTTRRHTARECSAALTMLAHSAPSTTAADGAVGRHREYRCGLPKQAWRQEEAAEASLAAAKAIPPLLGTIDHAAAHCP